MSKRVIGLAVLLVFLVSGVAVVAQDNPVGEPAPVPTENPPTQGQLLVNSWSGVTVRDVAGWRYENVSLQWVGDGQAIRMRRADGAIRDFATDEIERVTDRAGRDVTVEVAAGRYAAGQPALPVPDPGASAPGVSEVGVPAGPPVVPLGELLAAKPFSVALSLGVGYGTPSGPWFNGSDAGYSYHVSLQLAVTSSSYFRLQYRRQDLGSERVEDVNEFLDYLDVEMTADEFMLLWGFNSGYRQGTKIRSLAYVEFGPAIVKYNAKVVQVSYWTDSITKVGMAVNGGFFLPVTDNFALDMGIDLLFKAAHMFDPDEGGLVMGLHAGLVLFN